MLASRATHTNIGPNARDTPFIGAAGVRLLEPIHIAHSNIRDRHGISSLEVGDHARRCTSNLVLKSWSA